MNSLAQVTASLNDAPTSNFEELLARRRVVLERIRQASPEVLGEALRSGRDARSRLLVEMGAIRAEIEGLRRLRAGLGQLRPVSSAVPSLDVCL